LIPLTKSILKEIFDTFENQLPDLWKKHETRLFTIFEKHKLNTFEKELLPLLQDELWPLIKEEATPTIEGIGLELWSTFPKWSIAWKSVYQKIPGTDDDHVRKRWERYLAENVTPVIKLWTPEILKVLKRILIKTSKNPKISEALKKSLSEILNDTEFLAELMEIVRELFLQNELLRERLKKRVEEPEFQKQLQFLSARFEPYLTEIFHSILLDKKGEGISPNLAKVLRAELLRKDTRFIYVEFENMGLQPKELHFIGITRSNPFD
jgi:predicted house-cleaning noncanonical NTP pyrophosphatase (MazG superfamily)